MKNEHPKRLEASISITDRETLDRLDRLKVKTGATKEVEVIRIALKTLEDQKDAETRALVRK